jgi:hypothetical protein
MSVGDIVIVALDLPRPVVARVDSPMLVETTSEAQDELALVIPRADGTSQGAACFEVDGTGPHLDDDIRGLLLDLVRRGTNNDVPRSAALGNAAPTLRCSGTVSLGVSGLLLSTLAYRLEAGGA